MCSVIGLNRACMIDIGGLKNVDPTEDMQFGGHSLVRRSQTVTAEICLSLVLQDAN